MSYIIVQARAALLRTEAARKDSEIVMLRRKFSRLSDTLASLRDDSMNTLRKKDDMIEELERQLLSSSMGSGSSGGSATPATGTNFESTPCSDFKMVYILGY